MKSNPQKQVKAVTPVKEQKQIVAAKTPFYKFIATAENTKWLYGALAVSVVYFIILRVLFPIPSFYYDSYTYLEVARDHQPVSFRPIQYSEFINFFKGFSDSDFALIFSQFFCNVIANLLLFFTVLYHFGLKKVSKIILFLFLFINPLYLLSSNYVLADAFFAGFTVMYFCLLVWIIYKPTWYYITIQLILLILLFKLRYHAVIFPFFMAVAILLTRQVLWKKLISIAVSFLVIWLLVLNTIDTNENVTGVRTFSAFSGWQMANNALHVLRYDSVDLDKVDDDEVKDVLSYTNTYLDTTKAVFDTTHANASYMWQKDSPLKQYLFVYANKNYIPSYFQAWQALGPVYNKVGKTVILQHPMSYINHYVVPNTGQYFLPDMEAYKMYNENSDTLNKVAVEFYKYSSNNVGSHHRTFYKMAVDPWRYLFPVINVILMLSSLVFLATKKYRQTGKLFNKMLISFWVLYLMNFFFIVLLAPSVFRYHLFIITLSIPVIIILAEQILLKKQTAKADQ